MKKILVLLVALCLVPAFVSAQDDDISNANRVYFNEVSRLAFEGYGDIDFWSKQAKFIAFRSAVHLTSSAITINSDRDHGASRVAKVKQIVELNKVMMKTSQAFAFEGYGDTDYWSKRTKRFATELAMHTATVAGLCDKPMLRTIGPKIKALLSDAQNTGFSGYGDVDYWSKRCKAFATRVITLLGEINTELAMAVAQ